MTPVQPVTDTERSARNDYPLLSRQADTFRSSVEALTKRPSGIGAEASAALAEIDAARDVLNRAKSYAHACGLFTGGFEMADYVAIVELLRRADEEATSDDV